MKWNPVTRQYKTSAPEFPKQNQTIITGGGFNPGRYYTRQEIDALLSAVSPDIDFPYYQYIFKENATGTEQGYGAYLFDDFALMQEKIGGREVRLQFVANATPPEGEFNVDFQTWVGNGKNPDDPAVVQINFETGTTFSSGQNWSTQNGLLIESTSADPIYEESILSTHFFDRTDIQTTTAEFFKITGAGLAAFGAANGFGIKNAGYEVINVDSSPYSTVVALTQTGIAPGIDNNILRSTGPIVYGQLKQSSEAQSGFPTHANIDGASVDFAGGGSLFANAKVVGFLEGKPALIDSDNVSDALAEIRGLLEFDVYTPSTTAVTNVNSVTPSECQFLRVGDMVQVSGEIQVEATSNNAQTTFAIDLPIASNFSSPAQAGGTAYTQANSTNGHGVSIYADASNDRVEFDYYETHGGTDVFAFSFTYRIIE